MHPFISGLLVSASLLFGAFLLLRQAKHCFFARKRGRGLLAKIAGVSMIMLVVLFWILPIFARAKSRPRAPCQSNLHQFDLALQAHCYPPVETYPTNLAELDTNDIAPRLFVCPQSKNKPGQLTNVMEWTDYIYISGLSPAAPAEVPVFICPPMFHEGKGGNMLMGDHSCTWSSHPEYVDKLIEDPLAFCPNAPASLRSNIYVHVSKRIEEQSKGKYRSHGLK